MIMSSILRERQNKNDTKRTRKMDKDSYQRIQFCLKVLT